MKYQSKYAKYLKSVRLKFLIYVDLEVLVKKILGCIIIQKSSTTKERKLLNQVI